MEIKKTTPMNGGEVITPSYKIPSMNRLIDVRNAGQVRHILTNLTSGSPEKKGLVLEFYRQISGDSEGVQPTVIREIVAESNNAGGLLLDRLTPKIGERLDKLMDDPVFGSVFMKLFEDFLADAIHLKRLQGTVIHAHVVRLFLTYLGDTLLANFFNPDAQGYKILVEAGGYNGAAEKELLEASVPFDIRDKFVFAVRRFGELPLNSEETFLVTRPENGRSIREDLLLIQGERREELIASASYVARDMDAVSRIVLPDGSSETVANFDCKFVRNVSGIMKGSSEIAEVNRVLSLLELRIRIHGVERTAIQGVNYSYWHFLTSLMVAIKAVAANFDYNTKILRLVSTIVDLDRIDRLEGLKVAKYIQGFRDQLEVELDLAFAKISSGSGPRILTDRADVQRAAADLGVEFDVRNEVINLKRIMGNQF